MAGYLLNTVRWITIKEKVSLTQKQKLDGSLFIYLFIVSLQEVHNWLLSKHGTLNVSVLIKVDFRVSV